MRCLINELNNKLQYNDKESKIFMPNEIFKDLQELRSKGSSHIAFAYSYYYLICWLYRYAKYGMIVIDTKVIKQILGYTPISKTIDYIIKKNGILDELGYTVSTGNYPVTWTYEDEFLDFDLIGDFDVADRKLMNSKSRNYKIKYPIKAFHRTNESEDDNYLDGTFYDVSNTHLVDFDTFTRCMSMKELGVIGFYIYGFMKMKCQIHGEYNSSLERIANDLGIGESTADKYLGNLIKERMFSYQDNECEYYNGKFKRKANTYKIG